MVVEQWEQQMIDTLLWNIWNTIDKTLVWLSGLCTAFEEISNQAFSAIPLLITH
jgi:hypothetical protein